MRIFPAILTFSVFFAFGIVAAELAVSKTETFECAAKTCKQVASCEEATYLLNECGMSKLDRDGDGIPCETLCKGKQSSPMKKKRTKEELRAQILADLTASLDNIQKKFTPINDEDRAQDEAFRKEMLEAAEQILNENLNF